MFFNNKKTQEQRDLIISYKQAFGSAQGKSVLFDLMNRFHVLNAHDGEPMREGERAVVLYIMQQCKMNLKEFDKLLSDEIEEDQS